MFWRPRNDLSMVLAFETTRERNTAIMLTRRFAIDCNVCPPFPGTPCRCQFAMLCSQSNTSTTCFFFLLHDCLQIILAGPGDKTPWWRNASAPPPVLIILWSCTTSNPVLRLYVHFLVHIVFCIMPRLSVSMRFFLRDSSSERRRPVGTVLAASGCPLSPPPVTVMLMFLRCCGCDLLLGKKIAV